MMLPNSSGMSSHKGGTMTYHELMDCQQKELEAFPAFYAFSNEQFEEGKKRLGVVEDTELYRGYAGMFYRKKDAETLRAMMRRFDKEKREAFKDDKFFYDAVYSELANHEYCITYEDEETLDARGITMEALEADQRMGKIYCKARAAYLAETHCDLTAF